MRHSAWMTEISAANGNPCADVLHWELSSFHIIYDICDEHADHDEGLGRGNFPIDAAPLPHPFCTCLWYADTEKSLDEIAKELYRWEQGESVPRLDAAFGYWREENGFTINEKPDILKQEPIKIFRSLSAKARNYDIRDADGNIYHYVEDSYVQDVEVFAGYGTRKPLHDGVSEGLSKRYGGNPERWQHAKGFGIIDVAGEEVRAEVHWFQEETVGQVRHLIKRWLD